MPTRGPGRDTLHTPTAEQLRAAAPWAALSAHTHVPHPANAATMRGPRSRAGFSAACVSGAYLPPLDGTPT